MTAERNNLVASPGSTRSARRRRCAAVGLLVLTVSCASKSGKVTYHDPNMDFSLMQAVAVMPFTNLSSMGQAGDRTRDVFMTMLQATGALYVIPPGEVARGIERSSIDDPTEPTPEQIVALAEMVKADAVITGTVREYGQVRSGTTSANLISIGVQLMESETGRVVWSGSATKGGISAGNRLFGGGGKPMNMVTQEAIDDLLDQLFN